MTFEAMKAKLEGAGIQASASRLAVADFIFNTDCHPTAEEVKTQVEQRMPSVSTATIYNTLNLFVEKGLLIEVLDPKLDRQRYDCNTTPHFHLFDEESGRLIDIPHSGGDIGDKIDSLQKNYNVHSIEIMVRGTPKKSSHPNKKP